MEKIDDGGPAFPVADYDYQTFEPKNVNEERRLLSGMSLRDYFAAKAMQGFLAGHITHHGHESHWPYDQMASEALDVADAMLKARAEGGAA